MAQTERHRKLAQWLKGGVCQRDRALRELEISRSTLHRDIAYLRDRLGMPIEWNGDRGGWQLIRDSSDRQQQYELPGLHFTAEEVHALLTMQHLLSNLDAAGLLGPHIDPLMRRLGRILGSGVPPKAEVARRIRVRTVGSRRIELPHFQAVGSALLRRRRLMLVYRGRSVPPSPLPQAPRAVSPQRLVHYRDNWYLDAWCHNRRALRSFSVDAIQWVQVLDEPAIEIADEELDRTLGVGYGIFAGADVQWAQLRFSAERARWVAAETWHPQQIGHRDAEGRWMLKIPYADPRELVMDILRHVPDVEVLGPQELEDEVRRRLQAGLQQMSGLDE